jgi:S-adenosyl-methyltransferase mraW
MSYHLPVLLERSIDLLEICEGGTYADLTLGGGGHTRAILQRLGRSGTLYCVDRDRHAFENLPEDERIVPIHANYAHLGRWLHYLKAAPLDGVLLDLGVSSHHFDEKSRGFSYREDAPLDMRMNSLGAVTAADVIAEYSVQALEDLFSYYGELRSARRLAAAIVERRAVTPIKTTRELVTIIEPILGRGVHLPKILACVFQALRIEVNRELESLERLLRQLPYLVRRGGRVVVLSYHSLEDRLVKNFLRTGNCNGELVRDLLGRTNTPFQLLSKGVERASDREQEENSRSRSARMRVGVRL